MKTAVVCGAGGLIGGHMVKRLKREGYRVIGLSRRHPQYDVSEADEYWPLDLRFLKANDPFFEGADEIYQFACEVGGLGYIADPYNNAMMLRNSTLIDINVLEACRTQKVPKLFFASSACVYNIPGKVEGYKETDAYPANPNNEFAWQKLFAERLYQAYADNYGIDIKIGRLFNTYGVGMTFEGGREKSVAALCRKVAEMKNGGLIEVWGNGLQTRSFTYVEDAVEGIWRLMQSPLDSQPVNIGPARSVSIIELVETILNVADKNGGFSFCNDRPRGVEHINCNTNYARMALGWEPATPIEEGLKIVYPWIEKMVLDRNPATT